MSETETKTLTIRNLGEFSNLHSEDIVSVAFFPRQSNKLITASRDGTVLTSKISRESRDLELTVESRYPKFGNIVSSITLSESASFPVASPA